MTKKLKAVIVDDEKGSIDSLIWELEPLEEIEVVASFQDPRKAIEGLPNFNLDILFLDISMPGLSGLDILEKLKAIGLKRNILILSVYPQNQYAIRALRLGASGYLSKESAFNELELAIQKISLGQKYISLFPAHARTASGVVEFAAQGLRADRSRRRPRGVSGQDPVVRACA